jgi:hypothetical protein
MNDLPTPRRGREEDEGRSSSIQGVLSLGNAVVLLGGTLFTITGFFVSLNMRLSTVEATLRDFPLYRLETKISSLESTIQSMREDMKQQQEEKRNDNNKPR